MKKRRFTDKEILYIALRFFKKIDEIEFKIIRDIVARNFGEERVYKEILVLDDLSTEVSIKEKEALNGEIIKEFFLPVPSVEESSVRPTIKVNPGTIYLEPTDDELFNFIYRMSLNPEELTLRKIIYDPRISFLSSYDERKKIKKTYNTGMVTAIGYIITEKIDESEKREELTIELIELILLYLKEKDNEKLRTKIKSYEASSYIRASQFELTEKGMTFLREKMFEPGLYIAKERGSKIQIGPSIADK